MISLLIGIGCVVVLLVLILAILVAMAPSDFRVTRSATMVATPADVFPQVDTLRNWENWSPWAKIDPNVRNTYDGPPNGQGARFGWNGNKKVGEGRMTITTSQPNERVELMLEFFKPFRCTHSAEFIFTPNAGQTDVTWSMWGKNNVMAKIFGIFVSMDNLIGRDFEKGLAAIKARVEQV